MQRAFAIAFPLGLAALTWAFDLTRLAGAHPWWSNGVILIGVPLGLTLGLGLVFLGKPRRVATLSGVGAVIALAVAFIGKARFAASLAEDALAGRMWYFGWIAFCALATAAVLSALWPRPPAR